MRSKISFLQKESGFGLPEILVSIFIFGIVLVTVGSFNRLTFGTLGVENRISSSMKELRNAVTLLSTELRMSSSISPYIPGNSPALANCLSNIDASATTVRFMVVHDDSSASNGIQPYYVGYSYNPATRQLLRGEIPGTSTANCSLPNGDPTAQSVAKVIADNVYPWDSNQDGTSEPIFYYSNGTLEVNLSITASGPKGFKRRQGLSTLIYTRSAT